MRRNFAIVLAVLQASFLVAILIIFTRHFRYFDFICDDAYISFRYARNFVLHGELVYNPGEKVEGYTNFLWTILLSAGMWLGFNPEDFALDLGWFFGAAGIFLVWRAGASWIEKTKFESRPDTQTSSSRTVSDNFRPSLPPPLLSSEFSGYSKSAKSELEGVISALTYFLNFEKLTAMMLTVGLTMMAPLFLALSSSYVCWSSGGLETQMFAFLLSAGIFLFLREEKDGKDNLRYSGFLFALSAMTRPEGFVFFLIAVIWKIAKYVRWYLQKHSGNSDSSEGRTVVPPAIKRDFFWIMLFIIPVSLWIFWKVYYYGEILPNTFYVKMGFGDLYGKENGGFFLFLHMPLLRRGWVELIRYFSMTKFYIVLPFIFVGWLSSIPYFRRKFGGPACGLDMNFLLTVIFFDFFYFVIIGGDFMELGRFIVPVLPSVAILFQEGLLLLFALAGAGRTGDIEKKREGITYSLILKLVFLLIVVFFSAIYGQFQLASSAFAMTDHSIEGTDSIGYLRKSVRQWKIIGNWLKEDALKKGYGSEAVIATTAAGAIPYFSELKTLDMLGLNDRYISRHGVKGGNRPGHMSAMDFNYLLKWSPHYLIGHPELSEKPKTPHPFETAWMDRLGYVRRNVVVPGLDPPWFSFWFKKE